MTRKKPVPILPHVKPAWIYEFVADWHQWAVGFNVYADRWGVFVGPFSVRGRKS